MAIQYDHYNDVGTFYAQMLESLKGAKHTISMMYYAYDHGCWSGRINAELQRKAAEGVQVRLMVDEVGLMIDAPVHALRNRRLVNEMREGGIQVEVFRPNDDGLKPINRLHIKLCAIDESLVFTGGSNIGDYYTTWKDTNLRVEGQFGDRMHRLYDHIRRYSSGNSRASTFPDELNEILSPIVWDGTPRPLVTIPGRRRDIQQAMMRLIHDAEKSIHIRTWIFLPPKDILEALIMKAEEGVRVNILHSDRTRVPLIDHATYIHDRKLVKAGAQVWRYTPTYMHSKAAWNDRGDIIVGSANLDERSLTGLFECCFPIHAPDLAFEMQRAFIVDSQISNRLTAETFKGQSLRRIFLCYVCDLVSFWL